MGSAGSEPKKDQNNEYYAGGERRLVGGGRGGYERRGHNTIAHSLARPLINPRTAASPSRARRAMPAMRPRRLWKRRDRKLRAQNEIDHISTL